MVGDRRTIGCNRATDQISLRLTVGELHLLVHAAAIGSTKVVGLEERKKLRGLLSRLLIEVSDGTTRCDSKDG
jgi:hypothetical protein